MSHLFLQRSNPDEKRIDYSESQIEANMRHIDDLRREIRGLERSNEYIETDLSEFRASHYVLASRNESFSEHLAQVEYTAGYYNSVKEAQNDTAEYPEGWTIYDLNGKTIEVSK